jgi:hypothetical protein
MIDQAGPIEVIGYVRVSLELPASSHNFSAVPQCHVHLPARSPNSNRLCPPPPIPSQFFKGKCILTAASPWSFPSSSLVAGVLVSEAPPRVGASASAVDHGVAASMRSVKLEKKPIMPV